MYIFVFISTVCMNHYLPSEIKPLLWLLTIIHSARRRQKPICKVKQLSHLKKNKNVPLEFSLFLCYYLRWITAHSLSFTTHCVNSTVWKRLRLLRTQQTQQKADNVKSCGWTQQQQLHIHLENRPQTSFLLAQSSLVGRTGCLWCQGDISSNQAGDFYERYKSLPLSAILYLKKRIYF